MLQILLATYNSEHFLPAQLDSLLAQTENNFELLIHDGGSSDSTLEIIQSYRGRHPEKIRFLGSSPATALKNFAILLDRSDGELFMFCDHDDIWKPDKIRLSLEYFNREAEKEKPCLLFTDSEIVDESLKTLAPSMIRYQNLNAADFSPRRLIVQNAAAGHTMLFNRALKELLLPVPENILMHDHWAILAASFFGKILFLDTPTVYYRQHTDNVLGAFRYDFSHLLRKLQSGPGVIHERFCRNMDQAAALLELHLDKLSPQERELLQGLLHYRQMDFISRRRFIYRNKFRKNGLLRNIGMFLFA